MAKLAEDGKLPAEAPKAEAKPEPETTQGIGGCNASKPKEQPKRRPRTRRQQAKEAATA